MLSQELKRDPINIKWHRGGYSQYQKRGFSSLHLTWGRLEDFFLFLSVQTRVALMCSCLPLAVRNHLNGDDFRIFVLNQIHSLFNGSASSPGLNRK